MTLNYVKKIKGVADKIGAKNAAYKRTLSLNVVLTERTGLVPDLDRGALSSL